jgi:hypothetical protein
METIEISYISYFGCRVYLIYGPLQAKFSNQYGCKSELLSCF